MLLTITCTCVVVLPITLNLDVLGVHCEAKKLLNKLAFCSKSDTSSPLARTGGIMGVFLLLKNFFYVFHVFMFNLCTKCTASGICLL